MRSRDGKSTTFLVSTPRVYYRRPERPQKGGSIYYGAPDPLDPNLVKYLKRRVQKGGGVKRKASVRHRSRRRRTRKRRR